MRVTASTRLVTLQDLSSETGLPVSTLRDEMLLRQSFDFVRVGRRVFIVRVSFEQWLQREICRGGE